MSSIKKWIFWIYFLRRMFHSQPRQHKTVLSGRGLNTRTKGLTAPLQGLKEARQGTTTNFLVHYHGRSESLCLPVMSMQETPIYLLVLHSSKMGWMWGETEATPETHIWKAHAIPSTAPRERRKMTWASLLSFRYYVSVSIRRSLKMHSELCWLGCQRNLSLRLPPSAILGR